MFSLSLSLSFCPNYFHILQNLEHISSYNPIYLFWTSEIILEEDDFCCFI